jgi:outer membrane protein
MIRQAKTEALRSGRRAPSRTPCSAGPGQVFPRSARGGAASGDSSSAPSSLRGLAIAALGLALLAAAEPASAQSLQETIKLALAHDAHIESARQGLEAARLDASATARSLLPSLNLGGNYQYTSASAKLNFSIPGVVNENVSLARQHSADMNLGFQWTAFSGFAKEANLRMKRLEASLAENTLSSVQIQTALDAISAYRRAQSARIQIEILTAASERAVLQIDRLTALEKQGMAKKVDVFSLTIPKLDDDQKLIGARADLANALDELKNLTGEAISVGASPAECPRVDLPALDEASLDEIKALAIQQSIQGTNKKLALSKLYPTLALSGNLHYAIPGVNPILNQWMFYGTAGATLSWSFNWGGDSLEAQVADHNLARLRSDETSTRERIELNYASAAREWQAERNELDVLAASLDLARAKMAIVKSQYEEGLASTTDFNDANLELTQAELRHRSQILLLLLKANQIEAMAGRPVGQWSVAT